MRSLLVTTALCLATGPLAAEPLVRAGTSYYYIEGASALVLTEQINQKGPLGVDGNRHPTRTKWDVQWKFRHNMHDGQCVMEDIYVAVGITSTIPRWRGAAAGAASLKARWQQLAAAVERNKRFHTDLAKRTGEQMESALQNIGPRPDCGALTEAANDAASRILKKQQAAADAHDRRTDYARKDGASLI